MPVQAADHNRRFELQAQSGAGFVECKARLRPPVPRISRERGDLGNPQDLRPQLAALVQLAGVDRGGLGLCHDLW